MDLNSGLQVQKDKKEEGPQNLGHFYKPILGDQNSLLSIISTAKLKKKIMSLKLKKNPLILMLSLILICMLYKISHKK